MIKRVKQLIKTLDPVQPGSGVFFYGDDNPPLPPFNKGGLPAYRQAAGRQVGDLNGRIS